MALDLDEKLGGKKKGSQRSVMTPKSLRLNPTQMNDLEEIKERISDLANRAQVSDTKAFMILLAAGKNLSDTALRRAMSEVL